MTIKQHKFFTEFLRWGAKAFATKTHTMNIATSNYPTLQSSANMHLNDPEKAPPCTKSKFRQHLASKHKPTIKIHNKTQQLSNFFKTKYQIPQQITTIVQLSKPISISTTLSGHRQEKHNKNTPQYPTQLIT